MSERNSDRPNVLLICVDHWPGRLLGVAGHVCIMTPTLDQLAANGVRFTNAYSATPTCIPARRALMTGTTAKTHGDRVFDETLEMPELPTLAGTFSRAGYQCYAVGKLHVYPQRDRIGFDDVLLCEEGRHHLGLKEDDYEMYLADQGYVGQELTHGMCNNDYMSRPWHLPEHCHGTNWTVREMCRIIKRRDPKRPAFWYMSFQYPHPPLVPPADYLEMYRDADIPPAFMGDWSKDCEQLPYALKIRRDDMHQKEYRSFRHGPGLVQARRAFYAQCTYIDHQMRLAIGTLREEGLLDNTVIGFVSDHGDMLGNHGLFAKYVFYEDSCKVPLIIVPTAGDERLGHHRVDDRLVELRDVMPTLLDYCGLEIPESVEGMSLLRAECREYLYGEHYEDERSSRMIRDGRYKFIYYPVGNRMQLFDMENDPDELHDLSNEMDQAGVRKRLEALLIKELYGTDLDWIENGCLRGVADKAYQSTPDRGLGAQRGWRFI